MHGGERGVAKNQTEYMSMRNYLFLASLLLFSCDTEFKPGDKLYGTGVVEVFTLYDTITMKEIESMKLDIVSKKKAIIDHRTIEPRVWQTHHISDDQFYKRGNTFIGTIVSVIPQISGRGKKHTYFEIKLDSSIILSVDEHNIYEPSQSITAEQTRIAHFKPVINRYFVAAIASNISAKSDNRYK